MEKKYMNKDKMKIRNTGIETDPETRIINNNKL